MDISQPDAATMDRLSTIQWPRSKWVEGKMIGLPNSWPELLQSTTGMVGRTRAEQLLILGVVAAPCVLALLSRSVIAVVVAALLLGSSITAFQARPDVFHQWGITLAASAAGCLTCYQAARLRSSWGRMQRAEEELAHVQHELEAVRERLQREVYWRTAIEAHKAKQNSPITDDSEGTPVQPT